MSKSIADYFKDCKPVLDGIERFSFTGRLSLKPICSIAVFMLPNTVPRGFCALFRPRSMNPYI